jgi:uncharacterized membrane protein
MTHQDPPAEDPAQRAGTEAEGELTEFAEHAEHAQFAEFAEHAERAEFAEHAEHVEHVVRPGHEADKAHEVEAELEHLHEHLHEHEAASLAEAAALAEAASLAQAASLAEAASLAAAEHSREPHRHLPHLRRHGGEGDRHEKGAITGPEQPDMAWRTEMLHLLHAANKLQVAGMSKLHRQDRPEPRWPVSVAVILAIVFQGLLPSSLALRPIWLHYALFGLELALIIILFAANPIRIERMSRPIRTASIMLIFLITAANAASALSLVHEIVANHLPAINPQSAAIDLFLSGAAIWGTNVIAFALWYWEFDRGGPVSRLQGRREFPDLLFTQMSEPELTPPGWGPRFVDYLYFSFTNATAFSPTDVLPLARWAKLTMLVQSVLSLVLGVLVIARAVNILPLRG